MADFDVIVVGSGINSLVCAALLGKKGLSVCVIERNDRLGGAIRTEELTEPGFLHDVMSCWYPLFMGGPGYGALKNDLHGLGLEFCHTASSSGAVLPDQRSIVLYQDRIRNATAFDQMHAGEGGRYLADMAGLERNLDLTFGLLGSNLWSIGMMKRLGKEAWKQGPDGLSAFVGDAMRSARSWLDTSYESELSKSLFAPWVLHAGLAPDSALSGHMGRVIAFSLEQIGMPVVKGGGGNLVQVFETLIRQQRGTILLNTHAESVIVEKGQAKGVITHEGRHITARKAVICNVPAPVLYRDMLPQGAVRSEVLARASAYRFGRVDMQIHIALDRPAAWSAEQLNGVACIHVTPGMDAIARAVTQADSGLLPDMATIVAGQPAVVDPSRVPAGKGQLWIQLQELPRKIKGDAAGKIHTPDDGAWTKAVAEAYADRIVDRLEAHIPGLKSQILGRAVVSPADLERLNCNLVGGDPYCGDCGIDQFGVWRPFPGAKGHRTPIRNLWHIGASTHPGPGLGGVSGFLAAQEIG